VLLIAGGILLVWLSARHGRRQAERGEFAPPPRQRHAHHYLMRYACYRAAWRLFR